MYTVYIYIYTVYGFPVYGGDPKSIQATGINGKNHGLGKLHVADHCFPRWQELRCLNAFFGNLWLVIWEQVKNVREKIDKNWEYGICMGIYKLNPKIMDTC